MGSGSTDQEAPWMRHTIRECTLVSCIA